MKSIAILSVMGLLAARAGAQGLSEFRAGSVLMSANEAVNDSTSADTVKVYQLQEIVVTATRSERNPMEVGRSITLLTKEQMKNSTYASVAELLSQQEGLYVVGTGQNPGMLQSMFTRGAASNQTTIMIDEVRITDPSGVNNALDLSELSFAAADRIEIVRGSHSTLYGSSAIGGAVNIATEKNRKPGFNTDVELKTGTFGEGTSAFSANLFLNYTDPAGLYVNTEINNSNVRGLDATVDTVTNLAIFKNRDKDGFHKRDVVGKVGFRNDRLDVYASYKNTTHRTDIDKSAYRDDDNYTLNFRRNLFTYGASYKLSDKLSIKYLGGYSDMKRVAVDDSSIVDNMGTTDHTYFDGTWKGTTLTNEIQGNLKLKNFEGILGGGLYTETMTSKTYFYSRSAFGVYESRSDLDTLNLNSSTRNIFAHVNVNGSLVDEMFSPFSIGLGARLNDHSAYGVNITYEINPSLRIGGDALLYASYSTGFNAPSLYQLYAPDKNYISGITRGNRKLKPENSASYEIGFKQKLGKGMSLSVAYFNTIVEDAIENVYLWDKNIGIDTLGNSWVRDDFRGDTYLNVGKQTTNGIEFTITSMITDHLFFSGNLSLVSGKLTYNPNSIATPQTDGNHVQVYSNGAFITKEVETLGLVRRPNTANLSLIYMPTERLALRIDMRYVGARSDIFYSSKLGPYGALASTPVADYALLDLSQRYHVDEHLSVSARIENVFDTKYSEINGFTTRGRGAYLSVRYAFDQLFYHE
ncbi:MAG: TonB-dependent receptor [Ignavibacteriales bacterium]|nr:TonB-dependent receptor [Ignavibacteriales bacterium]